MECAEHMKAVTYAEYGSADVLHVDDVEQPAPKDDEILVRVRAASINALDLHSMRGTPFLARLAFGLRKPKTGRIGVDVSGVVEGVGKGVTQFRSGDEVFGVCRGAFAEYVCGPESRFVNKPANVSFEQAAAVPIAAITVLQGLRDKGKVHAGQKVLISGAGGGVGTFAVQIAKVFGAEVTAVTRTANIEKLRAIGADHVIDYTRDDFTKRSERYDLVFDVGVNRSVSDLKRALTTKGTWLFVGGPGSGSMLRSMGVVFRALAQSPFVSQNFRIVPARATKDDLNVLREFLEAGKIKPVIDRTYRLADVAEAMRHLASGTVCGKLVITVP
jgi:NADPH:quinone reductase-like Zn-dependent oxidoreductase